MSIDAATDRYVRVIIVSHFHFPIRVLKLFNNLNYD